jgi:hypothetical protein
MQASHAKEKSLTFGITALVATTAACLPRGAPPSGRQVSSGAETQLAAIVPPNGDGVLRILAFRAGAQAGTKDLYLLSLDAAGGPPSERLLASGSDDTEDLGCIHRLAPCSLIDPAGSIWVYAGSGLERVDPLTGDEVVVGTSWWLRSRSGQRYFISNVQDGSTLYGPDGSTTTLDVLPYSMVGVTAAFFGEDFYYLTHAAALMHVAPSGSPEQLATGISGLSGQTTPDGALLLLNRSSDAFAPRYSVLDPITRQETALSVAPNRSWCNSGNRSSPQDFDVSADGRWLLTTDSTARQFVFFDYRSGTKKAVAFPDDLPTEAASFGSCWRPGTFEIWLTANPSDARTVWVLNPDAPAISVPGLAFMGFTEDGAHWFSTASSSDANPIVVQVAATDDPTGPRVLATPPDTSLFGDWSLADGRLLTSVYAKDMDRADLIAVDLETGAGDRLAEKGRVVDVGQTRAVGIFHFESGAGDLTAVALDSGRQTNLAPEFATTAFIEPQGADPVAPGTRVVYQFQARTPSPYDGIWVVSLP